jgi:5-methylcytosine-specific restriction endonuclease McrA
MKGVYLEKPDARHHFLSNQFLRCNYCECYLDQYTLVVRKNKKNKLFPSCFDCNDYIKKFDRPPNQKKELPTHNCRGKIIIWDKARNKAPDRFRDKMLKDPELKCIYCKCFLCPLTLTIEHIIPKSLKVFNPNDESNLAPACYECNNAKANNLWYSPEHKTLPRFTKKGKRINW